MPDALEIPADLVDLQRVRLAAQEAVAAFAVTVDERIREEGPDPEGRGLGLRWTEDDSAELTRLRAVRDEAAATVRAHPVIQQALAEQCWPATWDALQVAAKAQEV